MSSVAVDKFGVVGKNVHKWTILLCNNLLIVSLCSNFGTSVRSPQTMFQLVILTLLLLSTRNPAICRLNIGSLLLIADMNCILQTLWDVKGTVFSTKSNTTSGWCQHPCSLTPVYAAFLQYMQLFISSSFSQKKLQKFTTVRYFQSKKVHVIFSNFVYKCEVHIKFLSFFIHFTWLFQIFTQSFYIALSQNSIRTRNKI